MLAAMTACDVSTCDACVRRPLMAPGACCLHSWHMGVSCHMLCGIYLCDIYMRRMCRLYVCVVCMYVSFVCMCRLYVCVVCVCFLRVLFACVVCAWCQHSWCLRAESTYHGSALMMSGSEARIQDWEETSCEGNSLDTTQSDGGTHGRLPQSARHAEELDKVLVCAQARRSHPIQKSKAEGW